MKHLFVHEGVVYLAELPEALYGIETVFSESAQSAAIEEAKKNGRFEDQNKVKRDILPDSAFGRPNGILEVLDGLYPFPEGLETVMVEQFKWLNDWWDVDEVSKKLPRKHDREYRQVVRIVDSKQEADMGKKLEAFKKYLDSLSQDDLNKILTKMEVTFKEWAWRR